MISNLVSRVRDGVSRAFPALDATAATSAAAADSAIVVAVSGGPDSLCLADALLAIAPERAFRLTLAHLDHGLRGGDSLADAHFVRAFAQERGVPCVVERADVRAYAEQTKCSIEMAARDVRYAFLARVAQADGAPVVALAHHADDQAETVLLRLLRGTGLSGLRGIQACSPLPGAPHLTAVRPLLRVSRADIVRYCAECGLHPRHDVTNDKLDHTRNSIRHELLPALERYNPNIRSVLTRLADTISSDVEVIEHATQTTFAQIARVQVDGVTVDRQAWRSLPAGLQRTTLREAVRRLNGDTTNLSYAAIEEARDVLNSDAGTGEIALPGELRILVAWKVFTLFKR